MASGSNPTELESLRNLSAFEVRRYLKNFFSQEEWLKFTSNDKIRFKVLCEAFLKTPAFREQYTLKQFLLLRQTTEKRYPEITGSPLLNDSAGLSSTSLELETSKKLSPHLVNSPAKHLEAIPHCSKYPPKTLEEHSRYVTGGPLEVPVDIPTCSQYELRNSPTFFDVSSSDSSDICLIPKRKTLEEMWDESDEEHAEERAALRQALSQQKKRGRKRRVKIINRPPISRPKRNCRKKAEMEKAENVASKKKKPESGLGNRTKAKRKAVPRKRTVNTDKADNIPNLAGSLNKKESKEQVKPLIIDLTQPESDRLLNPTSPSEPSKSTNDPANLQNAPITKKRKCAPCRQKNDTKENDDPLTNNSPSSPKVPQSEKVSSDGEALITPEKQTVTSSSDSVVVDLNNPKCSGTVIPKNSGISPREGIEETQSNADNAKMPKPILHGDPAVPNTKSTTRVEKPAGTNAASAVPPLRPLQSARPVRPVRRPLRPILPAGPIPYILSDLLNRPIFPVNLNMPSCSGVKAKRTATAINPVVATPTVVSIPPLRLLRSGTFLKPGQNILINLSKAVPFSSKDKKSDDNKDFSGNDKKSDDNKDFSGNDKKSDDNKD